ncbi:MAG TPA: MBL fold metallo-hydrolase [Spirochaetota bacterium]|nr:MBL fold metallo-hydrolase [Spirochaetota bacterium]
MIAAIIAVTFFSIIILIALFLLVMTFRMKRGRLRAEKELASLKIGKIQEMGQVDSLTITPLIDYYASDDDYRTEEGVSYLIKTGSTTILFDLGFNKKNEHPSPLMLNMRRAGVSLEEIDKIVISHIHRDHIGGNSAERNHQFSLSAGRVELPAIPVYSPGKISPSVYNPEPFVRIVNEPEVIDTGIATIGIYPRSLFLIGYTAEQSLAVNVKGKGIVLIIGCGHQGIDQILKRAEEIFDEPVYGIIGGLHLPVNGGRVMAGPFNLQNIVGVDKKPFRGIRESDVESAINNIKKVNPQIVSLSPHDSSDWTIEKFKEEFGEKYTELSVGKAIVI